MNAFAPCRSVPVRSGHVSPPFALSCHAVGHERWHRSVTVSGRAGASGSARSSRSASSSVPSVAAPPSRQRTTRPTTSRWNASVRRGHRRSARRDRSPPGRAPSLRSSTGPAAAGREARSRSVWGVAVSVRLGTAAATALVLRGWKPSAGSGPGTRCAPHCVAVLGSSGFPEPASPFQSTRNRPTRQPQTTTLPSRFTRSSIARSSLARRCLGMKPLTARATAGGTYAHLLISQSMRDSHKINTCGGLSDTFPSGLPRPLLAEDGVHLPVDVLAIDEIVVALGALVDEPEFLQDAL